MTLRDHDMEQYKKIFGTQSADFDQTSSFVNLSSFFSFFVYVNWVAGCVACLVNVFVYYVCGWSLIKYKVS